MIARKQQDLTRRLLDASNVSRLDTLPECRSRGSQEAENYQSYKDKEVEKEVSESRALVVLDGS